MKKNILAILLVMTFVFPAIALAGPKVDFGEEGWLKVSLVGQAHYSFMDGAADEDDFYLRRGRIVFAGQIKEGIKFFLETDNDNAGKNGMSVSTDVQDAFVDFQLGDSDHWLEAGLVLLPFSLEGTASATSLLGIDYNAEAIRLTNTFVWRDYGAMLHGSFGEKVSYAIGSFDGYETTTKNDQADLRYTGHVTYGVIGNAPKGWFGTQSKLGGDNYLLVGAGFDAQKKATAVTTSTTVDDVTTSTTTIQDSNAWVIDFQSAFNVAEGYNLTVNGGYYDWDNVNLKGKTINIEAGLLIDKVMVTAKWASMDPDTGSKVDDMTYGAHYYLKGNAASVGVEYRTGDSADWTLVGVKVVV